MATTARVSDEWRHGTAGGGTIPATNVMTGGGYVGRCRFNAVTRLDNIGPITGLTIALKVMSSTATDGSLYVSTSA